MQPDRSARPGFLPFDSDADRAMSDPSVVPEYLDLFDTQLDAMEELLADTPPAKLWETPGPATRSIGEQLHHLAEWLRCYRHRAALFYRAFYPVSWLLRNRPYPTHIDDVYSRDRFPNYVGFMCPERHTPDQTLALGTLTNRLREGHELVREFYRDKSEPILGHIWLYDMAIGWVNLIQALRIAVYHDQHHYDLICELCEMPLENGSGEELL